MDYVWWRAEYDAGFDGLRAAHWELRSIGQQLSPDKMDEEAARQRVEQAMDVYRACRTNIADFLLSGQPAGSQHRGIRTAGIDRRTAGSKDSDPGCGDEVRVLAHRLWEDDGRPMGSADEHWYRAEEMLHSGQ